MPEAEALCRLGLGRVLGGNRWLATDLNENAGKSLEVASNDRLEAQKCPNSRSGVRDRGGAVMAKDNVRRSAFDRQQLGLPNPELKIFVFSQRCQRSRASRHMEFCQESPKSGSIGGRQ